MTCADSRVEKLAAWGTVVSGAIPGCAALTPIAISGINCSGGSSGPETERSVDGFTTEDFVMAVPVANGGSGCLVSGWSLEGVSEGPAVTSAFAGVPGVTAWSVFAGAAPRVGCVNVALGTSAGAFSTSTEAFSTSTDAFSTTNGYRWEVAGATAVDTTRGSVIVTGTRTSLCCCDGADCDAVVSAKSSLFCGNARSTGCGSAAGFDGARVSFGGLAAGASRTTASSVPGPGSEDGSFLAGEFGAAAPSCFAPPCSGRSSNSVRLSKTFLKSVVCDAFGSLGSAVERRETTGPWRAADAGAERITAPLMQVRGHHCGCRLSARYQGQPSRTRRTST